MATWMIMLGIEAICIIVSVIVIAVWMRKDGGGEDKLDKRLAELSEMTKAREAMERD